MKTSINAILDNIKNAEEFLDEETIDKFEDIIKERRKRGKKKYICIESDLKFYEQKKRYFISFFYGVLNKLIFYIIIILKLLIGDVMILFCYVKRL